jgi:hypothetical protein
LTRQNVVYSAKSARREARSDLVWSAPKAPVPRGINTADERFDNE